jgi:lipid A ethanolaminephosphotransferase
VVVLHQLGNHGPSYFQRYPAQFRRFAPTCDTADLGKCSREDIVNSYDNAIRYTDHFLTRTIAALRGLDDYDTAMIYLSDHGESLGEKGLYLHGVPYAIAPEEQTRVPMVMWFSPGFAADRGLDMSCVRQRAAQRTDQDNLFPSVLGLMQVQTSVYDPTRDLFAPCT